MNEQLKEIAMQRKVFLALLAVCCLAAPALATITITAGTHFLLPNTPGQVRSILISSDIGKGISSADLGVSISSDGTTGPVMTDLTMDVPGTVFGDFVGGNTGDANFEVFPTRNQLNSVGTAVAGDTAASGVLAFVTIDTTGVSTPGIWEFGLTYLPFASPTSTSSSIEPFQSTVLLYGELICPSCPEPSSVVLGLFAMAGLCAVAIRRRLKVR